MQIQQQSAAAHHQHHKGLIAIGLFKLVKAIFFFCVGIGAVHFLHKDLGDAILNIAMKWGIDPAQHPIAVLLGKVDLIDAHRMKQIGVFTFGYSAVALIEGVGLLLEKVWAEYLTLILSLLFLPWELYELVVDNNPWRLAILLINIGVVIYLLWFIRKARELRARRHT